MSICITNDNVIIDYIKNIEIALIVNLQRTLIILCKTTISDIIKVKKITGHHHFQ